MNPDQISTIKACATQSAAGAISFGDVVARLSAVGVERYHADYTRAETTYYAPAGESLVLPLGPPASPIGDAFSASTVEASVRAAQRGEMMYPEFVRRTAAAGCVGYFVLLAGRQVQYFGRNGEMHVERFPSAPGK